MEHKEINGVPVETLKEYFGKKEPSGVFAKMKRSLEEKEKKGLKDEERKFYVIREITFHKGEVAPSIQQKLIPADITRKEMVKKYITEPVLKEIKYLPGADLLVGNLHLVSTRNWCCPEDRENAESIADTFLALCGLSSDNCHSANWISSTLRIKTHEMIKDYSFYEKKLRCNSCDTEPKIIVKVTGLDKNYEDAILYEKTFTLADMIDYEYNITPEIEDYFFAGTFTLHINNLKIKLEARMLNITIRIEDDMAAVKIKKHTGLHEPIYHDVKTYMSYTKGLTIYDCIADAVTDVIFFFQKDKEGNVIFNDDNFLTNKHYHIFEN
jgi:hypothetical protein